jgi:hypothetical protein
MLSSAEPVLVTTTTVWVTVLLTRLSPKSNAVVLRAAVVTGEPTVRAVEALWLSVPDVPVREIFAVPGCALADALILICP